MRILIPLIFLLSSAPLVAQQFGSEQTISTDVNDPYDLLVADISGDGYLDVVAASPTDNQVVWFESLDGQGAFSSKLLLGTVGDAQRIHAADISGDGDLDIISSGSNAYDKLFWHENVGGGTFITIEITPYSGNDPHGNYAADLDHDGDIDVLVSSHYDGGVSWYEDTTGDGDFNLERSITTHPESTSHSVVTADVNNDGLTDVISTGGTHGNINRVFWYENLGNGSFAGQEFTIDGNAGYAQNVFASDLD
ncbi:MAG: VCBS repeat-containing protein, partial [Planctomycetota bacterium]|nr:VCBS repeat-containing protein [Planctomycetota bacterium]